MKKLTAYNQYVLLKLFALKEKRFAGSCLIAPTKDTETNATFMDAGQILSVGPLAFGQYKYLHGLDKPIPEDLIGKYVYFKPKMHDTALFDKTNIFLNPEETGNRYRIIEDRDIMAFIDLSEEEAKEFYY